MTDGRERVARMDDIARHVGVSRSAVSFVLNNRPDIAISQATRDKIISAAQELGYRPHAGARALAAQRSRLLGMVTEIVTIPFGSEAVVGAQNQALRDGMFLMIAATQGLPDQEELAVERMLEQRVEGLVFATGPHRPVSVPAAAREVPAVLVHCFEAAGRLPAVLPDEVGGGYRGTKRLIDAGHHRIGLVNLERETPAAEGRLTGYANALKEAGIRFDARLVTNAPATADGGYALAAKLLDGPRRPTALFCCTDRMAMGAYDAIKERGLSIPRDVAVVGFDNQAIIAAYLRPALTTIQLPLSEMGAKAVTLLGMALVGQAVPDVTRVACPLVERASV